jgi:hypothetical protein
MWVRPALVVLLLGALLPGRMAVGQDAPKKDPEEEKKKDEEAKAKLADFRKDLKTCKSDGDFGKALERLGDVQHPKILTELKSWLGKGSGEVAIAAGEQLGKYKNDKEAAEALTGAAASRKEKDAIVKLIRYAGDVGYRPTTGKLTGYFRNKDVDVAKEAVDSCGKLRSRDAIDPLITMGRELESMKDDKTTGGTGTGGILGGGLGGGLTGGTGTDNTVRKKYLLPASISALEQISGQKFATIKEADDWWRKNKGSFKELE